MNVADIDSLSSLDSYVACTTEKIFLSKKHLYDIFVEGDEIICHQESLDPMIRLNRFDEQRYFHLNNLR